MIRMLVKVWRNLHPLMLPVGMHNGAASLENGLVVPQQFNVELAYDPTVQLQVFPQTMQTYVHKNPYPNVQSANIQTIPKVRK